MKKHTFLIYPLLLMGVFLVFASSCEKDDDDDDNGQQNILVLSTTEVTEITQTTATSGGNITDDGGATVTARGVCWSTEQTPTINDSKTEDGNGAGSFTSSITGLEANTTYHVRAYATNSEGTGYGSAMSFTTQEGGSGSSFTDSRDGNVYQTVTIGNQTWMAENLAYLPEITFEYDWENYTDPQYAVYGYAPGSGSETVTAAKATANYDTYGVLYNWPAAMDGSSSSSSNPSGVQGVCPDGWHLPSDAEWTELTDYLGGESVAGGKMKETGTSHWNSPNEGASNESGFSGLPGGYRNYSSGSFYSLGIDGYWWSATEVSSADAWKRGLSYGSAGLSRYGDNESLGLSVRCLKD